VLTHVRLLSRVCPYVDGESTALNEALSAARVVARVGALVGVYPIVTLEVRLAVEALVALGFLPVTHEGASLRLVIN
jgi:hypothetical protein